MQAPTLQGNIALLMATPWEAKSLAGAPSGVRLHVTGIGQENAARAAQAALKEKPGLVLCTGFAGALKAGIGPGDLVLDQGRSDAQLLGKVEELASRLQIPCRRGSFLSGNSLLSNSKEKLEAGQATGSIAAEMEGQAVYEACRRANVPFCSFRTISDTVHQDLPRAVSHLNPDGSFTARFWLELMARPRQWGSFMDLGRNSAKAGKNLSRVLSALLEGRA